MLVGTVAVIWMAFANTNISDDEDVAAVAKPAPTVSKPVPPPPAPTRIPNTNTTASTYCANVEKSYAGDTYFCIGSVTGDLMGEGRNWLIPAGVVKLINSHSDGHSVTVNIRGGATWDFHFTPPIGKQFEKGSYTVKLGLGQAQAGDVDRSPFLIATMHEMDPSKFNCSGDFDVLDFDYDSNTGTVNRLAVNFDQQCDVPYSVLNGTVRINYPFGSVR